MALPSDAYWTDAEQELLDILVANLMSAGKTGAQRALAGLGDGVTVDFALVNAAVEKWARQMGLELVKGISQTSKDAATRIIGDWIKSGGSLPDLTAALEPWFGPTRAELIGTTTVTDAFADGNIAAWKESGMVDGWRFNAVGDELVCEICGPLNGHTYPLDDTEHRPSLHPRCRCFVTPRLAP